MNAELDNPSASLLLIRQGRFRLWEHSVETTVEQTPQAVPQPQPEAGLAPSVSLLAGTLKRPMTELKNPRRSSEGPPHVHLQKGFKEHARGATSMR